jgi:8-oxo-dGTP pyrophosphatase MutT (NUDIX family)
MTRFAVLSAGDGALAASADLEVARGFIRDVECTDPEVRGAREQMLAFLDDHPDALHRGCAAGHLTGSAMVVDADRRELLLMLHTKLRRWLQPGGHADGDANLAAVALKEASEETGIGGLSVVVPAIDLDVHLIDVPGEPPHLHLDVRFLVLSPPGAVHQANHESLGLRWQSAQALTMGEVDDLDRPARAALATLDLL